MAGATKRARKSAGRPTSAKQGSSGKRRLKPRKRSARQTSPIEGVESAASGVAAHVIDAATHVSAKATEAGSALTVAAKSLTRPRRRSRPARRQALEQFKRQAAGPVTFLTEVARKTAVGTGHDMVRRLYRDRPPIQCSVDVAVPLRVAWREWIALDSLPEGTHQVTEITRDDDRLNGKISRLPASAWEAEILDERDEQSFAWQSRKGSDCAGLVTFHELSPRLTRIELTLDLVPKGITEALSLATRRGDRRATADLRRFKARVEVINPDTYDDETQGP